METQVKPVAEQGPQDKISWYNKKMYFWLSLLLWPIWLYALYKSKLYSANIKAAFFVIFFTLMWIGYKDSGVRVESDGAIICVQNYIRDNHHVTSGECNYEGLSWGEVVKGNNGKYAVPHTYIIRCFGNRIKHSSTFIIDTDGKTVLSEWDDVVY